LRAKPILPLAAQPPTTGPIVAAYLAGAVIQAICTTLLYCPEVPVLASRGLAKGTLPVQTYGRILTIDELERLGHSLADSVLARESAFIDAAVRDLAFPYSSASREVAMVVEQLRNLRSIDPWIRDRVPICEGGQEVALLLPYNLVSWALWDCACLIAAGNRVRVRFSRRAGRIAELAEATLRDIGQHDVEVVDDPGNEFVDQALGSDRVPLLIAYGSERLGDDLLERVASREDKKVVFEGPGKDPAIVLQGADVLAAAKIIAASKFEFSGQQCIAPEIIVAHESLHQELLHRLIEEFRDVRQGDPADPATQVGPMGSARVPEMIRSQLDEATGAGAEVVWGGTVSDAWVDPTIVVNVTRDMAIFQEESFGPVLAVVSFEDPQDAISLARSTRFGLSCMVLGPSGSEFASQLRGDAYAKPTSAYQYGRFGMTSVDSPLFADSGAALLPFGGYGKSGWIRDGANFLQGPKVFAHEASRPRMMPDHELSS
jgi:acyl-CoA reductase-like NAD-dependent aldehyde dehydrogenase